MNGCMDREMERQINGLMYVWMDEQINGWTEMLIDGQMDLIGITAYTDECNMSGYTAE